MKTYHIFSLLLILVFILTGCQQDKSVALDQAMRRIDSLEAKLQQAYIPGWGETMRNSIQIHHANLWFAGQEKNWELAEHMVEELEESFEKLRKWKADDPKTIAIAMIDQPLKEMTKAIEKEDSETFKKGYLTLTNTCNACHQATDNAIYLIQTPTRPAFSNQSFVKP